MKSKKNFTLSTNKLDISIFEFKDRPLFRKKESTFGKADSGKVEIRATKPTKMSLATVDDTSFTLGKYDGTEIA